jgi:hypothetical protein
VKSKLSNVPDFRWSLGKAKLQNLLSGRDFSARIMQLGHPITYLLVASKQGQSKGTFDLVRQNTV